MAQIKKDKTFICIELVVILMGSAIEKDDRMRFRKRISFTQLRPSLVSLSKCQLTSDLNFKKIITFLISAKGIYYFTSKLH